MIKSTLYIPASRERAFLAMTDYRAYARWTPGCEECTILSSSGSATSVEMVINTMRRVRLGLRFQAESNQLIQFELISGKDLRKYSGFYRFVPAADGKGTVLFAELDMELPSIPQFLTDSMAKKALGQLCMAFKTYVEKLPGAEIGDAAASWAQAASATTAAPRRRARRLLQIVRGQAGYRVSFLGAAFTAKQTGDNVSNP